MKDQETKAILKKYLPSKSKYMERTGYAWLASLIIGIGYGFFFMELSAEPSPEGESQLRLGLGFLYSLGLMFASTILLSIPYWVKVKQAEKKAIAEVTEKYINKN